MVVKRSCSFCAREIEPGTGTMFVKRDGTVYHFCSSSCRKQQLHLGRVGHHFKWTRAHELKRAADHSAVQKAAAAPAAKPVVKGPRRPAPRTETVGAAEAPTPAPPPVAAAPPAPAAEAPAAEPATKPKTRRPRKKAEPATTE